MKNPQAILGAVLVGLCLASLAASASGEPDGVLILVPQENFEDGDFFPVISALRASGVSVAYASPEGGRAQTTNGEYVDVDLTFDQVIATQFEAIMVTGGFGAFALQRDPLVLEILSAAADAGLIIAGVCAGSDVVIQLGFAEGRSVACTPERADFPPRYGAVATNEIVWVSRPPGDTYTLITSLGLAHAVEEFARILAGMLGD
ncbi:DJ-1/PfpI family protein [Candidatus Bipolaricaulota bacterium]